MVTYLLLNVPTALLGMGIVALAVAIAIAGAVLVRRSVELSTLEAHHDVAGFILAVVGVVYAVLLAFVVIAVWEEFNEAQATADEEAVAVGSVYRDVLALGKKGVPAREALQVYAQSVVDADWQQMATYHREARQTNEALTRVWRALEGLQSPTTSDSPFYDDAIMRLHDASELRRERIAQSGSGVPTPIWGVLIAGALITVGFTYLFGVGNFRAQALMLSALSSLIGLALFLILVLDLPFTGDLGVGPSLMQDIVRKFPSFAA
ncbi:MAG: DUF4239 domain-containing protein [Actinobacteria bacterium]|nr:DUF4239 domain-containing protein [Actinomycetota bacterium]